MADLGDYSNRALRRYALKAKELRTDVASLMAMRIAQLELGIAEIIDNHKDAEYILKRCKELIE